MNRARPLERLVLLSGAVVMLATSAPDYSVEEEATFSLTELSAEVAAGTIAFDSPEWWVAGSVCLTAHTDRPASDVRLRLTPPPSMGAPADGGAPTPELRAIDSGDFTEGVVCLELDGQDLAYGGMRLEVLYEVEVGSSAPVTVEAEVRVSLHSGSPLPRSLGLVVEASAP